MWSLPGHLQHCPVGLRVSRVHAIRWRRKPHPSSQQVSANSTALGTLASNGTKGSICGWSKENFRQGTGMSEAIVCERGQEQPGEVRHEGFYHGCKWVFFVCINIMGKPHSLRQDGRTRKADYRSQDWHQRRLAALEPSCLRWPFAMRRRSGQSAKRFKNRRKKPTRLCQELYSPFNCISRTVQIRDLAWPERTKLGRSQTSQTRFPI